MLRTSTGILALAFLAASCSVGRADYVLDQSYTPPGANAISAGANNYDDSAQTFTVGTTGLLGMVAVDIRRISAVSMGDLLIDVRATTATGAPIEDNSAVLASGVLAASSISNGNNPAFDTFDFSSDPISVVAGEQLAIVLRVTSPGASYAWYGGIGTAATYAGGEYYDRSPPSVGTWSGQPSIDLGFRTYVSPSAAVPEPASLVMLGIGIAGGLGYTRRHIKAGAVSQNQ